MRVISGRLGGRRLDAPKGRGTRPTSDRVKEALFSILGPLDEARVLDLYAGTGALGIEALSRGAARAVFVEESPLALAALEKNLTSLGLSSLASVVSLRVERATARLQALGPFDCAFVDPPYTDAPAAVSAVSLLAKRGILVEGAIVIVEHDAETGLEAPFLMQTDRRVYGGTALTLFSVHR